MSNKDAKVVPAIIDSIETIINEPTKEKTPKDGEGSSKKRRTVAIVWEDFDLDPGSNYPDGKDRAKCKHCPKVYMAPSKNGTSNLNRHLENCKGISQKNLPDMIYGAGRLTRKIDQDVFKDLLSRAIIKHGYLFSVVEDDGLQLVMAYLNDEFQSITRNTAKSLCLKVHKREKERLKVALS
ncbi:Zinc finger BED domain-containing protein RICESLEEPER 3 [Linum perenne]